MKKSKLFGYLSAVSAVLYAICFMSAAFTKVWWPMVPMLVFVLLFIYFWHLHDQYYYKELDS